MTQIKFSTNPTLTSDFPKLPAYSKSCLPDLKKKREKKVPSLYSLFKAREYILPAFSQLPPALGFGFFNVRFPRLNNNFVTSSCFHFHLLQFFSYGLSFYDLDLTYFSAFCFCLLFLFFFFFRYRRKCFLFVRRNLTPTRLERRWLNQEFLKYLSIKSIFYRESLNKMLHVFSLKSLPTAVCFFTHPLT